MVFITFLEHQVGTKTKNVEKVLVFKSKMERTNSVRPDSGTLAGTPCDSLKTLLEPFSVPPLGKNAQS